MKNNFDQLRTDDAWVNKKGYDSSAAERSKTGGKLFMTTNTASLTLQNLLVFIRYKPLDIDAAYQTGTQKTNKSITAFYEATTLYGSKDNLLFICMWGENNVADNFTGTSNFGLIHGFSSKCRNQSGVEQGDASNTRHQAYYDEPNCLSREAAAIAVLMKSSKKDSSQADAAQLTSGFSYEGGMDYIKKYAHIVKLPSSSPSSFGGKSIPNVITRNIEALPKNFSAKGNTPFPVGLENTETLNPSTDAQRLSNRIIDLMKLTNANTTTTTTDANTSTDLITMSTDDNQPYLGCILALIDISNMAEKFTISNMDVVFELISTGRTQ